MKHHRHQAFTRPLNTTEDQVSKRRVIHAIVENYTIHKLRAWLARHSRWTFHFTPTSASWLNAGCFAQLTRRHPMRGGFRSVDDLNTFIKRFVAETNADLRPFVWTADPRHSLAAVKRWKQAGRRILKRMTFTVFEMGQIFNLFIMPKHYYTPIASTRALRANNASWNRPIDVQYLPLSEDRQREVLSNWIAPFEPEYRANAAYKKAIDELAGPGYGPVEAQALHGFVRQIRPGRIIEIGSGVSTICMLHALDKNTRESASTCEMICIEPNPSALLRSLPVELFDVPVEEIELAFFDRLECGDLLFIDSTHAFRPAGDVCRIYLEILPRLARGVFIHIHDIYLPYAFQRDVDRTYMQSMETALLLAMLAHSTRYEILLSLSYLHYHEPQFMKKAFKQYEPQPNNGGLVAPNAGGHFPSSIYLRVN